MKSKLNRPATLAAEHGSAMTERYKQELGNMARRRLLKYPDHQAEAIAKHYATHATLALNLLQLIEARRCSDDPKDLDAAIAHCVEHIKNNHWNDFGIELQWPNA